MPTKAEQTADSKKRNSESPQAKETTEADAMNALDLLENDHREVELLFDEFDELGNDSKKEELAQMICMALTVHAQIEEEIFYPAARDATGDDELIDEAIVEHAGAKNLIAEIEEMSAGDELFDAKVKVLGEQMKRHIMEEEEELFPELAQTKMDLDSVGARLAKRKEELFAEMTEA
jgi:hemerythrin superfamily protein